VRWMTHLALKGGHSAARLLLSGLWPETRLFWVVEGAILRDAAQNPRVRGMNADAAVAGAMAEGLTAGFWVPLDVIVQRMQIQVPLPTTLRARARQGMAKGSGPVADPRPLSSRPAARPRAGTPLAPFTFPAPPPPPTHV
jgi:hypothetical protein